LAVIVIPAREKSTRLPQKLLIEVEGKPIIRWTIENCLRIKNVDRIIVATDSKKIKEVLKDLDVEVILTPDNIKTGSDRIAYVCKNLNVDKIVNIQGDEPIFNPNDIEKLINELEYNEVVTLAHPINSEKDYLDPNNVKVVLDRNNYALYFSRSPIPYLRDEKFDNLQNKNIYKHIGIYGYKKDILMDFAYNLKPPFIEVAEKLEQLRLLYNGYKIKVIITENETLGIDTKNDLEKFKNYIRKYRK
jgi:3-deoxy-manno-octulosonate cytidylyltransferase (CMP-KDO synthetase)